MFIAALFTIARTWKQPKCPSTDEWIKKMWHIYTMEYYSAIKRNEMEVFVMLFLMVCFSGPNIRIFVRKNQRIFGAWKMVFGPALDTSPSFTGLSLSHSDDVLNNQSLARGIHFNKSNMFSLWLLEVLAKDEASILAATLDCTHTGVCHVHSNPTASQK